MSPEIHGLRERKKQDKLARIERAARALFSKHGYEKTTTRQIADRAGIGVGTLFVYFPVKRDLLFHLFRSDVRGVKEVAFANLPDGNLVTRVMSVFETIFEYYARDPALSRVFVRELGFLVADEDRLSMNSLAMELMSALAGLVAEAQRTGEVDGAVNPLLAAYSLFSAYFAALVGWLGGNIPARETQLALLRGGLELLYRGLAPRPG